jgi:hypothetical protein
MNKGKTIVFMDTENTTLNEAYAEKLILKFREITGWKVDNGTRIHNDLIEFSKGCSVKKRDVTEVVYIFMMAHKIPSKEQSK